MGSVFTRDQLKAAAAIFRGMEHLTSPHDKLVALLEQDKERFADMEIHIPYAAYVLEWQKDQIMAAFPEENK